MPKSEYSNGNDFWNGFMDGYTQCQQDSNTEELLDYLKRAKNLIMIHTQSKAGDDNFVGNELRGIINAIDKATK